MVHTSPLDQAGTGDAGGMNVYVVETAKKMAQAGVAVDIFTRANKPNLPESIEIEDGVNVKHLQAGPVEGFSKEELPSQLGALTCRAGPNSPIASKETISSLKNQCLFIIKIDLYLCLLSKLQGFCSTG